MRVSVALAVVLSLGLALAACGKKDDDDERTAGGQVLQGTISDSMLPLDTLRSQPPLAKATGAPGEDGDNPEAEASDTAGAEGDSDDSGAADDAAPADEEG